VCGLWVQCINCERKFKKKYRRERDLHAYRCGMGNEFFRRLHRHLRIVCGVKRVTLKVVRDVLDGKRECQGLEHFQKELGWAHLQDTHRRLQWLQVANNKGREKSRGNKKTNARQGTGTIASATPLPTAHQKMKKRKNEEREEKEKEKRQRTTRGQKEWDPKAAAERDDLLLTLENMVFRDDLLRRWASATSAAQPHSDAMPLGLSAEAAIVGDGVTQMAFNDALDVAEEKLQDCRADASIEASPKVASPLWH